MSKLCRRSYVFDPRPTCPFLCSVKRYQHPSFCQSHDSTAVTLVFAHGNGFHKEQWEPTIEELCDLPEIRSGKVTIREAWSIDAPNQGDAAVLNEKALQCHQGTFADYARSIHAFLNGLGTGVDVDFSTHRIVAIGHSMGGASVILATTYQPLIEYSSVILVEPMLFSLEMLEGRTNVVAAGAMKRRDIWPSREGAYNSMKARSIFQAWDDRVLRIFVEHGLRPLPTIDYPDKTEGVTLKCSKLQEAAIFRDIVSPSRAYRLLPLFIKHRSVHFVYGAIDDTLPGMKHVVLHEGSGGAENFASVSCIEDCGHLVVQIRPLTLAEKIRDALLSDSTSGTTIRAVL